MQLPIIDNSEREKEIFNQALELAPEKRAAYLEQACGTDANLRRSVETLLEAYESAERFIPERDTPAEIKVPTVLGPVSPNEDAGTVIGRYKLLQPIGEGGFGAVYMAEQREPVKRRVALKIIKLGMDTRQVVARFEAERQALALMDHPNIAKVLDAGATATGRPYFVMELVRGVKITDFCDKENLSTRDRLLLFKQVCHAVQHAHQKGIIHRDLKPSNVLVTLHDGVPIPKVIDFGIAKATTDQQLTDKTLFTAIEQFVGTPAYMSPEQAEMSGLDVDTRTDIYSLGVLLYELLIGKTPFEMRDLLAGGIDAMRRTIREKEPARPSTRLSTLDQADLALIAKRHRAEPSKLANLVRGDLDWIVMKAIEKDRARRYDTADALASDIQRHLNNEPIFARPVSSSDRILKWARRRPAAAALAAVIAVASVTCAILAAIASKQAILATRRFAEAEHARRAADEAAKEEQIQRTQLQRNVVRQYVANGTRLMNEGDLFAALLWYVEALRLDAGADSRHEEPHRIRVAAVLRQCPKLLNVFAHGAMLYHAEFSPEGDRLITASDDRTARLWDVRTGESLQILRHDDEVNDAAFSRDGLRIVTSSKDKTARIWDAETGVLLHSLQHAGTVWRSTFSADGSFVATACEDGSARMWNANTGESIGTPFRHESAVGWVVLSPDGRLMGTETRSDVTRVWEVESRRERIKTERNMSFDPVSFSPDGKMILICEGPSIRVWNASTFTEAPFSPLSGLGTILDAAFSDSGEIVVGCGEDFSAQLWSASSGEPLLPLPVRHSGPILEARIGPDKRRFLTAGQDTIAQLWNLRTGAPVGASLKHILHVKFTRFNADGRRLLFNSCDQAARIWDLATSDLSAPIPPTIPNDRRIVSPNGQYRLAAGDGYSVWIEEAASGRRVAALPHPSAITYASFSPDGRTAITACEEDNPVSSKRNDIFLWDAPSGRRLNRSSMSQDFLLLYVAFTQGSRNQRLLTCGFDFSARVWDARTGQPISPSLRHGQRVSWGAFSPDEQSVVTASWDKTVRVWDAYTGNPLSAPLQHRSIPTGAFWSADGKRLHTVTVDRHLQIWDLETGEPLTPPRKIADSATMEEVDSGSVQELPRDDRPVDDLVALSRMLAVARIDSDGNTVPLQLYELKSIWEFLRKKYPAQFAATTAEIAAWHQKEARDSESENNPAAVLFHRKRAAEARLSPAAAAPHRAEWRLSIPLRDPNATPSQVDLFDYYNLGLSDSLDQKPNANDLSQLPDGLHVHGGVLFDVRGLIHLTGQKAKSEGLTYPEAVPGIPLGRKCRRLHFLEGASRSSDNPPGVAIGSYVLHYSDGQRRELPIVYGRDVVDWWQVSRPSQNTVGPVWTAPNRLDNRLAIIGIFKNSRENPRPEVEVTRIDFVSRNGAAAPFLVALTVE